MANPCMAHHLNSKWDLCLCDRKDYGVRPSCWARAEWVPGSHSLRDEPAMVGCTSCGMSYWATAGCIAMLDGHGYASGSLPRLYVLAISAIGETAFIYRWGWVW